MKTFLKVMKALSDPNRVKIIKLLEQKKMCVCELQGAIGIAQPTVSKHLRILEEAGLVDIRQEPAQFKLREPRDMRVTGTKPNT